MLTRRQLAPALVGLTAKAGRPLAGGFVFESQERGHRIRDRARFTAPKETRRVPVLIVGGGIAGLSCAWWLDRSGFHDFALLEMESEPGGNSRAGRNEISAFPWSAHYLPVPGPKATLVRELCRELGLLHEDGSWEERWLCHSPQERLFLHGRWQEGLEPHIGMTRDDVRQFDRFSAIIQELAESGEFAVPMETGARRRLDLDRQTMASWMQSQGIYADSLKWLVDYSCRDDYGTRAAEISAWAGLHYFCSRPAEEEGPLTWPQGNGWIVERLLAKLGRYVHSGQMVHRIEAKGPRLIAWTEQVRWECDWLVFAAPTYLASWLIDPAPPAWPLDYAPWLIANLTLDRLPANKGAEPAWDNVIYQSAALGYVDATHQSLASRKDRAVWTWYLAMADGRGADQRRLLLGGDWAWWTERVLADLERAHPDIRQCVSRIDIFRNGHAMPKPLPGFLNDHVRTVRAKPRGRLVYANSDLSGLSLFEEAQWRGVEAARHVLAGLSR